MILVLPAAVPCRARPLHWPMLLSTADLWPPAQAFLLSLRALHRLPLQWGLPWLWLATVHLARLAADGSERSPGCTLGQPSAALQGLGTTHCATATPVIRPDTGLRWLLPLLLLQHLLLLLLLLLLLKKLLWHMLPLELVFPRGAQLGPSLLGRIHLP